MAGTGGTGGTGGNGGTGGCTSASGELAISLDWKGGGDLDLGMQTPLGSVAPGFEGQPGADPDCTHGGNDTGTLGQETMTCPNPPAVGNYEIHVDSEADEVINFTLTVTVGGQHVSPLEFGIPPLQTGTSPVMSSIPAGSWNCKTSKKRQASHFLTPTKAYNRLRVSPAVFEMSLEVFRP